MNDAANGRPCGGQRQTAHCPPTCPRIRRTAAAVCLCIPRLVVVLWTTAGRTRRPQFCGAQTNAWSMCLVRSYHIGLCTSTRCTASKGSSAHVSPSRDAGSGRGDVHASRPEGRATAQDILGLLFHGPAAAAVVFAAQQSFVGHAALQLLHRCLRFVSIWYCVHSARTDVFGSVERSR